MSFAKDFEFVLIDCQLSSSHQKVTGSFHDITEKLFTWHQTTMAD
jgi:Leu/Phe-tRNA-protein transferase